MKHPLSQTQQRLWFMSSLTGGTTLVSQPVGLIMRGALELRLLEDALRQVIRRHDALRLAFRIVRDGPEQIVLPEIEVRVDVLDVIDEPTPREPGTFAQRLARWARASIDPEAVPQFRAGVLRVGPGVHAFSFVASPLVWDRRSTELFVRELCVAYEALARGEAPTLTPPIPYGRYALWHRHWVEGPSCRKALDYWTRELADAQTCLELPLDHPRPAQMSYRGAAVPLEVSDELAHRVRVLARDRGLPVQVALLAGLKALLWRYSGQTDLLVAVAADGRLHPEAEALIGPFGNTLVLRSRLDPRASFSSLLDQVRKTWDAAHAHRGAPFELLVEELRPARDRSRTPLYQVMFTYDAVHDGETSMGPVRIEPVHLDCGMAATDLTCSFRDDGHRIQGTIEYATDLFEQATIARIAEAMTDLLEAVVEEPERALDDLPLSRQHARTLDAWNATRVPYASQQLLHRLFEARVDGSPTRTAVVFENDSISYRSLDERACRIARHLRALGVGRDVRVGVCLRRSIDLVATLIAVHKAGGCYVPLDPTYPAARLEMMLEDSGARVLVVGAETRDVLAAGGARRVDIDEEAEALAACSGERLDHEESSDQLAYVIYTSGSTGRPKGVLVEHRNVVNFFRGMEDMVRLEPDAVWLAGTSISFDISVLELFGSLTHGLTVVLLGEQRLGAIASEEYSIPRSIERHGVTHFQCTPSQAAMLLLDAETRAALGNLQKLLVGGEALPTALARDLGAQLRGGELVNMYGPTETTVWSTTHVVMEDSGTVPIGRPIANTVCYVLDANGRRLPIGAVGELYIGGDGVVRGYHERPDLTAQRFLPDPFRAQGHRMYRTGDLVRYRSDGLLEYRGRNDFQVKIRGHRIELGEIEALLEEQSSVSGAAVVAVEEGAGDVRLAAYVVGSPGAAPDVDTLREALKQRLPPYMVPASIVALAEFPLTPNGKIDRKALPRPTAGVAAERRHVEPADDVERDIAALWAEAIGLESVGADDDFFELGGHSLLGVRILTRIHQKYGVRLSLSVLFDAPTVATLARVVRSEMSPETPSSREWFSVVPVQPRGSLPPFFCVAGMGGNPMNLRHVAAALGPEQPFYGLQHRGVDGNFEPHATVEDMAREFIEHMQKVQPEGPYFIGGFSGGGVAAFEVAHQLLRAGQAIGALILLEAVNPQLAWSPADRVEYHLQRLRQMGLGYIALALSGRIQRQLQRLRLSFRARAAQHNPYEFRNEAVMQAWLRAERQYQPKPYPGDVTLLRSKIRDIVVFDPYNGWRPAVAGALEVVDVDGGHTSFVELPYADQTARELARVLARARAGLRTPPVDEESEPRPAGRAAWTLAG